MNDDEFKALANEAYGAGLLYAALGMRNTYGIAPEVAAIHTAQYYEAASRKAELDVRLKTAALERVRAGISPLTTGTDPAPYG